jgi:hypothetical protein
MQPLSVGHTATRRSPAWLLISSPSRIPLLKVTSVADGSAPHAAVDSQVLHCLSREAETRVIPPSSVHSAARPHTTPECASGMLPIRDQSPSWFSNLRDWGLGFRV